MTSSDPHGRNDAARFGGGPDGGRETVDAVEGDGPGREHRIAVFGRSVRMPQSRWLRIAIGIALVLLGCLGFLPILGFWMIPAGLLVLSYEFASIRRYRRRTALWWGRRRAPDRGKNGAS